MVRWRSVRGTEMQRTAAGQTAPLAWPLVLESGVVFYLFGSVHYHTKSHDLLLRQ